MFTLYIPTMLLEERWWLIFIVLLGVGIDGGNTKDWETNTKNIQLIKQTGKVKALNEEIHSEHRANGSLDSSHQRLFSHIVSVLCLFAPFQNSRMSTWMWSLTFTTASHTPAGPRTELQAHWTAIHTDLIRQMVSCVAERTYHSSGL